MPQKEKRKNEESKGKNSSISYIEKRCSKKGREGV